MSPRRTVSSDSRSSGSSAERPAIAKTAKLRRALLERSGARQGLDPEERHRKLVGAGALGGEEGRGVLEGPSGLFVTSRLEERSSEIGTDEGVDRGASLTADLAEGAGVLPSGLLRPPEPEQAAADAVQDGGVGVPPLGGGERGERGAELDERLVVAPEIRQVFRDN